ncbi:MAG: hypothetical protein ABIL09_11105 [Gemmatimonadota bacterium]
MSDAGGIVKKVRTDFTVSGLGKGARSASAFGAQLGIVSRQTRQVTGLLGRLSGVASGVLAVGAIGGGVGLVKTIIDIGSAAQNTELSMTGLLEKGFGVGFKRALSEAKKLRLEMKEAARTSPVTRGALEQSWQNMTLGLGKAGVGLKQQVRLAKGAALGDMRTGRTGETARDVKQLLSGSASDVQIGNDMLKAAREDILRLVKQGKLKDAIDAIEGALAPSKELSNAWGESFGGQMSTSKDNLDDVLKTAAQPLMKWLIRKTKEWGKWLKDNSHEVERIATAIGEGIVSAVEAVLDVVRWIADHWSTIASIAEIVATVWLVRMISNMGMLVAQSAQYALNMGRAAATGMAGGGMGARLKGGLGKVGRAGAGLAGVASMASSNNTVGQVGGGLLAAGSVVPGPIGWAMMAVGGGLSLASAVSPSYTNMQAGLGGIGAVGAQFASQAMTQAMTPKATTAAEQKKKKRRGGRGGAKVGKMSVDKLEVKGSDLARIMSPTVRAIQMQSRFDRPLASSFGLGASVPVANGLP